MFHNFLTRTNKQPNRQKPPYLEYIYTAVKPSKGKFDGLQTKIGTELKDNIVDMRQEFRRLAEKIKNRYNR